MVSADWDALVLTGVWGSPTGMGADRGLEFADRYALVLTGVC